MKKCYVFLFVVLFGICNAGELNAQCGPVIATFPYSEGFETVPAWTTGVVSGTNDWAWGTPTHPSINAAATGSKCWCVGGLSGSSYFNSDQCWIMSPCFDFTTLNNPWISFHIYWECEHQWDGLVLQYSLNGGTTWTNVGAFGDPVDCLNQNWYNYGNITWLNSLPAGSRQGWSGRTGPTVGSCQGGSGSNGWVTAKHCMSYLANQPNVRFRFLFGSGTTCNAYDGEAIDDILIDNAPPNVANFSWACAGTNTVNFSNLSTPCATAYAWNFGDPASGAANTSVAANPSHTFSGPGTYTVTLNSSGPCNAPGTVSMPVVILGSTMASTNPTCNGANNGSATVSVSGGAGPFTYSWSPSGGSGVTASNLSPGTYSVTISAAGSCATTASVAISQPNLLSAMPSQLNPSCNGGTGAASVVVSGGTAPYSYAWTPSGGTGATTSPVPAGTYTCTITDANGCVTTQSFTLVQPTVLSSISAQGAITCSGGTTTASVTASGGTAPYSYVWSPTGGTGATSAAIGAGSYTCTITDANGCVFPQSFTITQPVAITATSSQGSIACNGGTTTAAVAASGGIGPYTYSWSPSGGTGATSAAIGMGSYTCTITDSNGCIIQQLFSITEPTPLLAPVSTTPASCGGMNGTATVNVSGGNGPYTYSWAPSGGTGATASGLTPGSYTVTVTSAGGCTVSAVATVGSAGGILATSTSSGVSCPGGNNGSVTATPTTGTGPYTYAWSPSGDTTATVSGLVAGSYTCIVTDVNGCSSTLTVNITEPGTLTISATATPSSVCAGSAVQLSATAAGGTSGYSYSWLPGSLTGSAQNIIPVASTTYTVSVVDANGCSANTLISVGVNPVPVSAFAGDTLAGCAPLCVDFSDLSSVTAPGQITSWQWNFGDGNTSTLQNPQHCYTVAGNYSVVLTSTTADGCASSMTLSSYITTFATPVAGFVASPQPTTITDPEIYFTDSSSNAVTWNWTFGDLANSSSSLQNPTFVYANPICYTVQLEVSSVNGCTDTTSREICIDPEITIYTPNAFTPNNDGNNDFFFPKGEGIDWSTFHMYIFDRWGNLIYETTDINKPWDGKANGGKEIAQQDVYIWKISVKDISSISHNLVGHVSLIK